jgi:hypothetical protein
VASWAQDSAFFDQGTHQGFQLWTVPKTGTYRIQAYGAQGGNASGGYPGGLGARLRGDFELAKGDQVTIVVGQRGRSSTNGGGGGGSFVWQDGRGNPPMLVAGGGGGAAYYRNDSVNDAVAAENAPSSDCSGSGTNGQGGPYHYSNAGAGAGWLSDGAGGSYGGDSDTLRGADWSSYDGGFGGGGSGDSNVNQGSGGGGGYSGGSSGCNYRDAGAGGGSYNAGANPSNASAARTGHGQVEIQFLGG